MHTDQDRDMGMPLGAAPTFTDCWSDLLQASLPFFESQLNVLADALAQMQMRKGSYGGSQYIQDVISTWEGWATLVMTSLQFGTTPQGLPALSLIVDGDAELVGPMGTPTSVLLPPGVTTVVTDLHRIGGRATGDGPTAEPQSIDASRHVRAQLSPARDRVEVTLVDLGRGQSERDGRGIVPGLYVGAVYAMEAETRRPLAVLYVLVEESPVP
jgi:hypothetical protein